MQGKFSLVSSFFCLFVLAILLGSTHVQAAETWISCTPREIMTYQGRIHVKCAASVGGVRFFAISTQDSANAARVLSVITAAQVAGRTLTILYDPADLSGAAIGCQTNDCRLIRAVGFGQ
jgi:hypothetical protein